MMDFKRSLGLGSETLGADEKRRLIEYLNLKLAFRECPIYGNEADYPLLEMTKSLLANFQEKNRLLADYLCPADYRIQKFLDAYLKDLRLKNPVRLPTNVLVLEQHGQARMLSLPPDQDSFESDIVKSYRVMQGVIHNPRHDRRTTKGVFHVAEGGLPVPADKKSVPKAVFARLLREAFQPPAKFMRLPFTSTQEKQAEIFVSLLLRPVVCPPVPGIATEKSMEIRFFVPGSLVSNLDFVESIFGNAGDPYLPDNDAALDVEHWTGHTGCVILAPHLSEFTKKELGLPHVSKATDRQKRDGMCWESEEEKYNDGGAFKITGRDRRGVIVTLIADNYFGYCKKEVKTQLSYAANLYGLCEEEHAGGAVAFPSYDLGDAFRLSKYSPIVNHSFEEVKTKYQALMDPQPSGYGIDKQYPDIIYVPEDVQIHLRDQELTWKANGEIQKLKLLTGKTYVLPSGYKVEMIKPSKGRHWRLVGTAAEGTFCHKPCTVSGGGKSEISKSLGDATLTGPVFVADFRKDFELAAEIIKRDYRNRFREGLGNVSRGRELLHPKRSLGSVIKLLTPNSDYTDEYNEWLKQIPRHVKDLVLIIKRFYRPEWGEDWQSHFSVDIINGAEGNELKYHGQPLITQYLRLGFTADGSWRTFTLRKDFFPARKLQMEDDISASAVVPAARVQYRNISWKNPALKFVTNCEYRFFQRPDEAIVRGFDLKAELDFSHRGNFFSNYEPLSRNQAHEIIEDTLAFDQFTPPMQQAFTSFVESSEPEFLSSSAHPRLVDGKPCKNPRYLQTRPDLESPRSKYLAELGTRLYRRIPLGKDIPFPVNAVLAGRRNNPPDRNAGIRSLAVYNPVHYQELPELFMDFISSLTGKSPSTTGAGSEGALTKGPFNALLPVIDLNNALISYLLTGYDCFTTAAGHIGPKYQVDHDISLLIPEIWARMSVQERMPENLIKGGFLERCEDFEFEGKLVPASRLGYRITERFVQAYFGRVFSNPDSVCTREMLQPELQDMESYVDGIRNIVETQQRVAKLYFEDGSIDLAIPPLKALLHIMAHGNFEGKDAHAPEIRKLFEREAMLKSDWYRARLEAKQKRDIQDWTERIKYLDTFLSRDTHEEEAERLNVNERVHAARRQLKKCQSSDYLRELEGTLGLDPSLVQI